MNSPIENFFKLGEKVTKGDPKKTLDFNYYLLWIMFIGFLTIMIDNLYLFFQTQRFYNLGWSVVMCAILWFQYQGLAQTYQTRKMLARPQKKEQSQEEMMKEFKDAN